MLRVSSYETVARNRQKFAYAIIGNACVFSGLEPAYNGGTVSYARNVMQQVRWENSRQSRSLHFFDLATYQHQRVLSPGQFSFLQVVEERRSLSWEDFECPDYIVKLFWPLIGGRQPIQMEDETTTFKEFDSSRNRPPKSPMLTDLFAGTNILPGKKRIYRMVVFGLTGGVFGKWRFFHSTSLSNVPKTPIERVKFRWDIQRRAMEYQVNYNRYLELTHFA